MTFLADTIDSAFKGKAGSLGIYGQKVEVILNQILRMHDTSPTLGYDFLHLCR